MKASDIKERAQERIWIWPLTGLTCALALAAGTLYADAELSDELEALFWRLDLITGDPAAARAVLSAIVSTMVSLLVFTFTMTVVVIQLASAQYSPRFVRSVLRDTTTKLSLSLFIATFAYALLVLRSIVERPRDPVVPELSLAVTYVLVLASLLTFILYIDHVARSLRVDSIVSRVRNETIATITRLQLRRSFGAATDSVPDMAGARGVRSRTGGVVARIHEELLLDVAHEHGATISLCYRVGDHVPARETVALVRGEVDDDSVLELVVLGPERTMQEDVAFGIRQLVDIANRALSPGINDPSTAVMCLDSLEDVLRRLAREPDQPVVRTGREGRGCLFIPRMTWEDYVVLATTEIRLAGAGSPQVPRRLEAMLRRLLDLVPVERRSAVERELRLLEATVARERPLAADSALMRTPDRQGLSAAWDPH